MPLAQRPTPEDVLADETCLDARTVTNAIGAFEVALDDRGWHDDNRVQQYGQHFTFSIMQGDVRRDTCHVYEHGGNGCHLTVCQQNYGGHGVPDGLGFYWYFNDTNP